MAKLYVKNEWQDEILAGDERLDIKADDGTPIEENVQITLRTSVIQAGTPVDAARMNNIELGLDAVDTRASSHEDILTDLLTGWLSDADTWVYVSATQLKIVGKDVRSRFPVGTKIRLTQGTVKYFYAIDAGMSGSDTLITLTGGSDYTLANAAISSPYYSYASAPQGFPQWFNYTPTWSATTTNPTVGNGLVLGVFTIDGRLCTVHFRIAIGSTTALGTGYYHITMPVSANTLGMQHIGSAHCEQPGVAHYVALTRLVSESFVDFPYNASASLAHNNPVTWAVGANINGSIQYPI